MPLTGRSFTRDLHAFFSTNVNCSESWSAEGAGEGHHDLRWDRDADRTEQHQQEHRQVAVVGNQPLNRVGEDGEQGKTSLVTSGNALSVPMAVDGMVTVLC